MCSLREGLRKTPLSGAVRTHPSAMEFVLISLIALGCLVYLVIAVLFPEKF
ncbi:MAG: potassium-transporting ATPase subunit F [Opitutaceae bacterium]|nr:potassium-transporting ATPase subunit F [Opitutaceae bacterium]